MNLVSNSDSELLKKYEALIDVQNRLDPEVLRMVTGGPDKLDLKLFRYFESESQEIPEPIFDLITLEEIDFYDNGATKISKSIGKLVNLEDLNLEKNKIRKNT